MQHLDLMVDFFFGYILDPACKLALPDRFPSYILLFSFSWFHLVLEIINNPVLAHVSFWVMLVFEIVRWSILKFVLIFVTHLIFQASLELQKYFCNVIGSKDFNWVSYSLFLVRTCCVWIVIRWKLTCVPIFAGASTLSLPHASTCASTICAGSVFRARTDVNAGSLSQPSSRGMFYCAFCTSWHVSVHCKWLPLMTNIYVFSRSPILRL